MADEVTKELDSERYDTKHMKVVSSITGCYRPQSVVSLYAQRKSLAAAKGLTSEEDNCREWQIHMC